MIKNLIEKNCSNEEHNPIFPITTLDAVLDASTNKTLSEILEEYNQQYNHVYLPFVHNSKAKTRQLVPDKIRRKGLWITYVSCRGNVVTEWYNSDDFSDVEWGSNSNWVPYMNKEVIREMVNEFIGWYKA